MWRWITDDRGIPPLHLVLKVNLCTLQHMYIRSIRTHFKINNVLRTPFSRAKYHHTTPHMYALIREFLQC
jgi:hypothetical protein